MNTDLDFAETLLPVAQQARAPQNRRQGDRAGPGPRLLTASTLKGDPVLNLQDETLGHLEELMLDTDKGRVAYAVLASGGFMGMGERLFAIPWSALRLDPDRQCLVMDADKAQFDSAPGFDKNHWPSMAQREWHEEIHRHYAARPYWD